MPSITLTFSTEHAVRIATAMEDVLELDRPATAADVKSYVVDDLKQLVRSTERRAARDAAEAASTDVDFT